MFLLWTQLSNRCLVSCQTGLKRSCGSIVSFVNERFYCSKTLESSSPAAREAFKIQKEDIPKRFYQVSFCRSSGPGGQNVNKLNTKAELRMNVHEATFLPDWVRQNLATVGKPFLTLDGTLVIKSQRHRTQLQNINDALMKLADLICEAGIIPKETSEAQKEKVKQL
eukprot:Sdes_comp20213_c0_seq6m13567